MISRDDPRLVEQKVVKIGMTEGMLSGVIHPLGQIGPAAIMKAFNDANVDNHVFEPFPDLTRFYSFWNSLPKIVKKIGRLYISGEEVCIILLVRWCCDGAFLTLNAIPRARGWLTTQRKMVAQVISDLKESGRHRGWATMPHNFRFAYDTFTSLGFKEVERNIQMSCPLTRERGMMPIDSATLIREATVGDAGAIARIFNSAYEWQWHVPTTRRQIEGGIRSGPRMVKQFFVALVDGEIVGAVEAYIAGDTGSISNLAVSPEAQGRKVGRSLLTHAMRMMLERGCKHAELDVYESNTKAMSLYTSLGFLRTGRFVRVLEKRW